VSGDVTVKIEHSGVEVHLQLPRPGKVKQRPIVTIMVFYIVTDESVIKQQLWCYPIRCVALRETSADSTSLTTGFEIAKVRLTPRVLCTRGRLRYSSPREKS
jgi:hypothetical protein